MTVTVIRSGDRETVVLVTVTVIKSRVEKQCFSDSEGDRDTEWGSRNSGFSDSDSDTEWGSRNSGFSDSDSDKE